jgi:hypothetical protein
MDLPLLTKLFGTDSAWQGPCTVVILADATVETVGGDSLLTGGVKNYAPRLVSGRLSADAICLLADHRVLVLVQQVKQRLQTGEERIKQTALIVDITQVAAVEFAELSVLKTLGLSTPTVKPGTGFQSIG